MKWEPIETAPKDGTQFCAMEGNDFYRCSWREEEFDGEYRSSSGWWDHFNESFENPTHWILPPDLPE